MDLLTESESDVLDSADGDGTPSFSWDREADAGVLVSAEKGWNLDDLLREIENQLVNLDGPLLMTEEYASGWR